MKTLEATQRVPQEEARWFGHATVLVLVVAVVLRLALALVSLQAYDNHMAVSQIMAFEHRSPGVEDAHQAYHPKLYHGTVALIWRALPDKSVTSAQHAAQVLNVLAATLTLVVVLRFLRELKLHPQTLFLAFALCALNPRLVAVQAMATNDAFVILFSTLTLYFAHHYFARWRPLPFVGMLASAVLAMLSKSSGLLIFIAIAVCFGWAVLAARPLKIARWSALAYGVAFVIGFVLAVSTLGPYVRYYREYGTPLISNHPPAPRPHFFKETYYARPGVTSISKALFTFRLVDLVRHPVTSQGRVKWPKHRTSIWSTVYGSAHFSRFDDYPSNWRTRDPMLFTLARLIFVLALLPTGVLIAGLLRTAFQAAREWLRWDTINPNSMNRGLWALVGLGFPIALVLYAMQSRSFVSYKAIYLYPPLLAYLALFSFEWERVRAWYAGRKWWRVLVPSTVAALLVLYTADIAALVYQMH